MMMMMMVPDYYHHLQCCAAGIVPQAPPGMQNLWHKGTWRSSCLGPGQKDPCQLRLAVFIPVSFPEEKHVPFPLILEPSAHFSPWRQGLIPAADPLLQPGGHDLSPSSRAAFADNNNKTGLMTKKSGEAAALGEPLQAGREPALQRLLIPALEGWKYFPSSSSGEEQTLQVFADRSPPISLLLG